MKFAQIVLIEDNPGDVFLVKKALQHFRISYALTQFDSGTDAIRVLLDGDPEMADETDAILLDLNTPNSDGFEVIRRLKETPRTSQIPVAVLTSSRSRADRHRAAAQGARFIEKPSGAEEFLNSVGHLVGDMLARR